MLLRFQDVLKIVDVTVNAHITLYNNTTEKPGRSG